MKRIVLTLLGANGLIYKAILPTDNHFLIGQYHQDHFSDYKLLNWKIENVIILEL